MTETREETAGRLPELKERHLPVDCREAVHALLKETYGYEQFRDLEVYDDLFKGKDTLHISQGQLIESVIAEAERARNGETEVDPLEQENPCCSSCPPSIWAMNTDCLPL